MEIKFLSHEDYFAMRDVKKSLISEVLYEQFLNVY